MHTLVLSLLLSAMPGFRARAPVLALAACLRAFSCLVLTVLTALQNEVKGMASQKVATQTQVLQVSFGQSQAGENAFPRSQP